VCLLLPAWLAMARSLFLSLQVLSPPPLSAHAVAVSPADSDDEGSFPSFPPRNALVSCDSDDRVLI
jgi:hypothetical protein